MLLLTRALAARPSPLCVFYVFGDTAALPILVSFSGLPTSVLSVPHLDHQEGLISVGAAAGARGTGLCESIMTSLSVS